VLSAPGASESLESMIASTKRGLLLTCLWYIRLVDPQTLLLTGLTRDGVYLVEEGARSSGRSTTSATNESPVGMLSPRARGRPRRGRPCPASGATTSTRAAMPPLRIEGFNMSSVSQAS